MNSKNMHYCYNVEYFQDMLPLALAAEEQRATAEEIAEGVAKVNRAIYQFQFADDSYRKLLKEEDGLKSDMTIVRLKTIYPGLFIGSGYSHSRITGAKAVSSIIGGFFFDYVTGLPVIPGSSLKGVLRSYFPKLQKPGEKRETMKEMLAELIGQDRTEAEWENLEENLFEGNDVFLGGFPVLPKGGKLLDSEYITPHKDQFKNPIPLRLLKVSPGVTFEFLFLLYDYKDDNTEDVIMTAKQKSELYRKLLLLGGIGAKTNVGFGQFEEVASCS